MTEHALSFVGYDGGEIPLDRAQLPMRILRDYPPSNGVFRFPSTFPLQIRPYVLAAPAGISADQFGVAFPAGLLLMVTEVATVSPALATFNLMFEKYWANLFQAGSLKAILVPASLPSGYTPSLDDGWTGLPATGQFYYSRTADGPRYSGAGGTDWRPTNQWGLTAGAVSSGFAAGFGASGTGYRKVQVRAKYVPGALPIAWSGSAVATFTAGGTPTTHAFTAGDFSNDLGSSTWGTDYVDIGPLFAALGVQAVATVAADLTGVGADPSAPSSLTFDFKLSPRVDIPFATTQSGYGDLIAPGGYVP